MHQRNVVVAPEQRDDLLGLGEPQQAVVDEHAGELLADRLVDQHRRHRRVDAAGKAADHPALADLGADLLDRLVLEGAHGPIARGSRRSCARNCAGARRRAACARPRGGTGWRRTCAPRRRSWRSARSARCRPRGSRPAAGSRGRRGSSRPDSARPSATRLRTGRLLGHQHLGAAEFAVMPGLDHAAELLPPSPARRSRCRGSERRPGRSPCGASGASWSSTEAGPAGQDHALRPHCPERLVRLLERHDLAIDLLLAHPPRDQLGHLRAEIDDEDLVVGGKPVRSDAAHEGGIEDGHLNLCAAGRTPGQGRPPGFTTGCDVAPPAAAPLLSDKLAERAIGPPGFG